MSHLIYVSLIVLAVAFITNLHRLLNFLVQISRPRSDLGSGRKEGTIERSECTGSRFTYERPIDLLPVRDRRGGGWVSVEERNYVGTDSRRHRGDPRTHTNIVHNSAVAEVSSIGDLFAYLWNGMKALRRRRRRIEHKSSVQPIRHARYPASERSGTPQSP